MPKQTKVTAPVIFKPYRYRGYILSQRISGDIIVRAKSGEILYEEEMPSYSTAELNKKHAEGIVDRIKKGVRYNAMQCEE